MYLKSKIFSYKIFHKDEILSLKSYICTFSLCYASFSNDQQLQQYLEQHTSRNIDTNPYFDSLYYQPIPTKQQFFELLNNLQQSFIESPYTNKSFKAEKNLIKEKRLSYVVLLVDSIRDLSIQFQPSTLTT